MHSAAAHEPHAGPSTPLEVTEDLLGRFRATGAAFRLVAGICAVLFIVGVVGFVIRWQDGTSSTEHWGYYAALVAFLLTTAQAAPMVAIVPRLTKAHWHRSTSRAAELFAAVGLYNLILFIPLLWILPSLEDGRRTLWFFGELDVPAHMPHIVVGITMVSLTLLGLALLWLAALPDQAAIRDRSTGSRQRWARFLARGWLGTSYQWFMQYHRIGMVGAFYFMTLIFTHFMFATDFSMALVPGWFDALYPITHAHNGLQAGVATVIIAMFVLRRFGGYKEWLTLDQFWGLGKLMFALSLLWFWFWFSSFIVLWYGSKPNEEAVLELLVIGPYLPIFLAVFMLVFVVPLFTMMWNPLRKSIWGPTIIAVSILVGTLLDRIRLYVAAFSVEERAGHELHEIPGAVLPEAPDLMILVGGIAGAVLVYMLASKVFPAVNIWEQKELLLYQVHKKFHRTEVQVLGKPD